MQNQFDLQTQIGLALAELLLCVYNIFLRKDKMDKLALQVE